MPAKSRWAEIEIESPDETVEAAGQSLVAVGCSGFTLIDSGEPALVRGYLPVDDRLEGRLSELKDRLARFPEYGLAPVADDLTIRHIDEEEWATAWKAYFKPIPIGRRLVIAPPWESPALSAEQIAVIVDPGMAFGTGSHPTTQLCLAALDAFVQPGMSVADIGTGSGILAIAAKLLGAGRIAACDIDPLAVEIARGNAEVNRVEIDVSAGMPMGEFDIVVANILADVILDMRETLIALTRRTGLLIVSGIIDTRAGDVKAGLTAAGVEFREERAQGEWRALIFRRP